MPTTLKDIAQASGCSFQAVSAILRNQPGARFRSETRERVLKAAEELGYRPNSSALAMRAGRTGCVAVLKGTQPNRNALSSPVLGGITQGLDGSDLHLAILTLDDERLTSAELLPKILREAMADGVLVKYDMQIPARLRELLTRFAIPAVWINSEQAADCVRPDDLGAGTLATERLLGLGHRRIAYVDFSSDPADPAEHYSCRDRYAGYAAAMLGAGLAPRLLGRRLAGGDPDERLAMALASLRRADRPTAIVCRSAWSAYPFWHAALLDGLRVPAELSIISFDSTRQAELGAELSQYQVPEWEMGRDASLLLVEKLADPALVRPPRILPFTWMPGRTVAAPSERSDP